MTDTANQLAIRDAQITLWVATNRLIKAAEEVKAERDRLLGLFQPVEPPADAAKEAKS